MRRLQQTALQYLLNPKMKNPKMKNPKNFLQQNIAKQQPAVLGCHQQTCFNFRPRKRQGEQGSCDTSSIKSCCYNRLWPGSTMLLVRAIISPARFCA